MSVPEKTVFIFDDDEDILSICSYILQESGWSVHTSTDCSDVLEKVSSVRPDIILMDNRIPDEGGIKATQRLKASHELKHIPVIYFSANSDIKTIAEEAGANSYLAKPFDLDDLETKIRSVMLQR